MKKGLVIEIMIAKAEYPTFDSRPALNESQWIQYQLDNAKSIEDVINNDKNIRISKIQQDLHFLITDKEGNSVVIEFIDNKMKVYKGEDLPFTVLENDLYETSIYKKSKNKKCRFNTALYMVNNYKANSKETIIDYSFKILEEVALDGSWSIVYDIKNMQIHFTTASNRNVQTIFTNQFNFDCSSNSMLYDLLNNNKGNVSHLFIPFDTELNKEKINKAIISNRVHLPENILSRFYNYPSTCDCVVK